MKLKIVSSRPTFSVMISYVSSILDPNGKQGATKCCVNIIWELKDYVVRAYFIITAKEIPHHVQVILTLCYSAQVNLNRKGGIRSIIDEEANKTRAKSKR